MTFQLHADALLSFFFEPYPTVFAKEYAHELDTKLKKPGRIARHRLYHQHNNNIIAGIYSTYGGFIDISDVNGQTSFPLKHDKPRILVIITTKVTPIIMAGNTVHHWELEEGTPTALYVIEKKQDTQTKLWYWEVQQHPYIEDRKIPVESLIILARPKDIYVPLGISLSKPSPHIILPTLYVKKGIKSVNNALYLLNLKQFFGPITYIYKRQAKQYSSHVTY